MLSSTGRGRRGLAVLQDLNILAPIREKVEAGERLDFEDGLTLLETDDLLALGDLADVARRVRGGNDEVYFVQNLYLNQTNVCRVKCKFCAFAKTRKQEDAYTISADELVTDAVAQYEVAKFTEIHCVNGENPHVDLEFYADVLRKLKSALPDVHLKFYTASEIHHMSKLEGCSHEEVLRVLKDAGLDSMPGGGAEIFAARVRQLIAPGKEPAEDWFDVHDHAHRMGIPTHCTLLYGHVETYEERIDHMLRLRTQQDATGGFLAFIPLAFHPENTVFERRGFRHTTGADDLKMLAVARLMIDNIPNIKAYWIMMGMPMAQLALHFGANDVQGTVVREKIFQAAGATSAPSRRSPSSCASSRKPDGSRCSATRCTTSCADGDARDADARDADAGHRPRARVLHRRARLRRRGARGRVRPAPPRRGDRHALGRDRRVLARAHRLGAAGLLRRRVVHRRHGQLPAAGRGHRRAVRAVRRPRPPERPARRDRLGHARVRRARPRRQPDRLLGGERVKLGRISYVNMAPVFYRVDAEVEEVQGVPTELNRLLVAGELDTAPISSIEYARNADKLRLLPRLCVASEGAVDSIQLVTKKPLEQVRVVAVTPESATSVVLTKVLLPDAGQVPLAAYETGDADAKLLIGDAALKSAFEDPTPHYDLGRLWLERTGLPMVFAVWACPEPLAEGLAELEDALVASVRMARAEPERLAYEAAELYGYPPGFLARYFEKLRYRFGPRERAGLYTFLELARDAGLLETVPELRFVQTTGAAVA